MAQLVEHNLAKVGVAGSSPVVRSSNVQVPFPDGTCFDKRRDGQVVRQGPAKPSPPVRIRFSPPYADMAQLVEHNLAKVGVAGWSPVCPLQIDEPLIRGAFSYCQLLDLNELMDEIVSNLRIFFIAQNRGSALQLFGLLPASVDVRCLSL